MKNRVFYIDAVRACACILVVSSHVFAPVCAGMNDYSRPVWWLFNLLDSLIRPSAGLYVMISGKLFLGSSREEPYSSFVMRRYARIFWPFFCWSMVYSLYNARLRQEPWALHRALVDFIHGPTEYHLWFMYMILGLYLVMPVLRRFVRTASNRELATLIGVWLVYLTIQQTAPKGWAGFGPATTLLAYGGYAVLGYALDRARHLEEKVSLWWGLGLAILLGNAAGTYWLTLRDGGTLNESLYSGAAPLVAVQGAAMFLLLKQAGARLGDRAWLRRLALPFSRHSYNIYLNHALFIWIFTQGKLGFILSHDTGPNPLVGVALTTVAVMIASLGTSLFLQRIPLLSTLFVISVKEPAAPRPAEPSPSLADLPTLAS